MMDNNYRDLIVYQKSYSLTLEIYKIARTFPREELFALSSQIKCAAYSIPLNIAEGYGKKASANEFKRFILIALGSSDEMSVLLDLCKDLEFVEEKVHKHLSSEYQEIGKMLNKLHQSWSKF